MLDSSQTESLAGAIGQEIPTVPDKAGDYIPDPDHPTDLPFTLTANPEDNIIQVYYVTSSDDDPDQWTAPSANPGTLDGAQTIMQVYYAISDYFCSGPVGLLRYLGFTPSWDLDDIMIGDYGFTNSGVSYQDFKNVMLQWVSEAEFNRLCATDYDNVAVFQNVSGKLYVLDGGASGSDYVIWNYTRLNSDPNHAEFKTNTVCSCLSITGTFELYRFVLIKQNGCYVVDECQHLGKDPATSGDTFFFYGYPIDYSKNTITGFATGETIQDFSDGLSSWIDSSEGDTLTIKWFNNGTRITNGVIKPGMMVQIEYKSDYYGKVYAEYTVV